MSLKNPEASINWKIEYQIHHKNDRPEYWYRQQNWYQCVDEKEEIQEFLLRSGDQNSVQCCLVSATAGEVPGWHEIKYRVM